MSNSEHWAIIINPKSGKRNFRRQQKYLFLTLKHAGIEFDYRLTRFAGHASKIARYFVEKGYRNIMVLGGDGTMSEVINGIFSSNIVVDDSLKIALIPRGTGNDWARFWGLTTDYKKSIDVFLKGKIQPIDIGKVEYEMEGIKESHYFINSIGLGLDAAVVNLTHRLKEIFGSHGRAALLRRRGWRTGRFALPAFCGGNLEKWVVRFFLGDGCERAVAGAEQGVGGER